MILSHSLKSIKKNTIDSLRLAPRWMQGFQKAESFYPVCQSQQEEKQERFQPHSLTPSRKTYFQEYGIWNVTSIFKVLSTKWELWDDGRNGDEWKAFIHARAKLSACKTERQVKQHEESKYRLIAKPPCGRMTSWTPEERREKKSTWRNKSVSNRTQEKK